MKICGIDPSINSSGKCIMDIDPDTYEIRSVKFYGYSTTNNRCISGDNFQIDRVGTKYDKMNMFDRQNLAYGILEKDMEDVKYISFEGYALGVTKSSSIFQLGEFIGGLKKFFYDKGKGIMIYPPTVVKKFATGNGSADKTMMRKMIQEEYPQWYPQGFDQLPQDDSPHSDLCDAFWICETMRNHILYEKVGPQSMDEGVVALLEYKSGKKAHSIVNTKMVKKCETQQK